jgi:SAM-dependent methyltransferase
VFEDVVRPRLLAPAAELMLDALPPLVPQMRFLEVQAGGGVVSRPLVERIAGLGRLVTLDDDAALAGTLPIGPRRAARGVAAPERLPFASGVFDVALLNLVLGESRSVDDLTLDEVARVLKVQGHLIATTFVAGSFAALIDIAVDVADGRGADDLRNALTLAKERLPTPQAALAKLGRAGLMPVNHGICEHLLGLYRGDEVRRDPLLVSVLLASLIDGAVGQDLQGQLTALAPALAQTVDGWFKEGMPVVARTLVMTARRR